VTVLFAPHAHLPGGVRADVLLEIVDGRFASVRAGVPAGEVPAAARRLPGVAVPGFANAHSHAFQRRLRGRTERLAPDRPHDDFWTWREAMYGLADTLDPDSSFEISRGCFREMLRAGYSCVAEFHYVHHQPDGVPYADPNALAKVVVEAARAAGIRLLMLPVAYARGGIPRFRDADVEGFLERVDALRGWAEGRAGVEVGVAAHSVRAVPRAWLERLASYAGRERLPLHVHACEQPREIEECLSEHGMRPVELLLESGFLGPRTTVVHATHASARELDLLAASGSTVCACPTTEGNLGDGFLPARGLLERGVRVAIGSDSHVRIDPLEELREIETNARRLVGRRNVLVEAGEVSPASWLLRCGWQAAGLAPGAPADMVEIDLRHPSLADVQPPDLPAALVFGAGSEVVAATWVAGERVGSSGDSRTP
jgi:formimidoylglutamate deiminase